MSGQAFVGSPVLNEGIQTRDRDLPRTSSAIPQSRTNGLSSGLQQRSNNAMRGEAQQPGPLAQIINSQDSLYRYISWENPGRTILAYFAALSVLLGVHYLPLTSMALKIGSTILGVVFATDIASRSLGFETVSSRFRPRQYYQVPEHTLNATLKDVHDFVQYAVVHAQKIVFGHDLSITLAAFIASTTLFWLIKFLSPFGLVVLALTSVFATPLIASPRGREVAHEANVRTQELTNSATNNSKVLAQEAKDKVSELPSQTQQDAFGTQSRVADSTQGFSSRINENTSNPFSSSTTDIRIPQMSDHTASQAHSRVDSTLADLKPFDNNPFSSSMNNNSGIPSQAFKPIDKSSQQFGTDHMVGEQRGLVNDTGLNVTSTGGVGAGYDIVDRPRDGATLI